MYPPFMIWSFPEISDSFPLGAELEMLLEKPKQSLPGIDVCAAGRLKFIAKN